MPVFKQEAESGWYHEYQALIFQTLCSTTFNLGVHTYSFTDEFGSCPYTRSDHHNRIQIYRRYLGKPTQLLLLTLCEHIVFCGWGWSANDRQTCPWGLRHFFSTRYIYIYTYLCATKEIDLQAHDVSCDVVFMVREDWCIEFISRLW